MKNLYSYEDKNEYQTYISFYIAESRYEVIKMVMADGEYPSLEDMGEFSVTKLNLFQSFIKPGTSGKVDLFEDPYWINALYSLGGYLTFPDPEIDDYYQQRPPATLSMALSEETKKYDEERMIILPKKFSPKRKDTHLHTK